MILDVCENVTVLEVLKVVKTVITIIRIVVPLILIISLMVGYTKAIKDHDTDLLARANKVAVSKAIAALLVFFIPTFVNIVVRIVDANHDTYISCLNIATSENITIAHENAAREYVRNVKETLNSSEYVHAVTYINKNVKNETVKKELLNKLEELKTYIDIKEDIDKIKINFDESTYNSIENRIKKVKDSDVKTKLEKLFSEVEKPYKQGTPSGERKKAKTMSYSIHTPTQVSPNMPLILYLHGDGGATSDGSSPFLTQARKHFGTELPFILVTPAGGMWQETSGRLSELKSIIDEVCEKYECNKNRISVTGHSRGSIGTWHIVNNYPNFFYSAVPVSCGSYRLNVNNFKNTKVKAFGGNVGQNENRYSNEMSSNVAEINKVGGNATFTLLKGAGHGDTPKLAYTKETMLWMIN